MPSGRFQLFVERIDEIRSHLLPDPFNPTGDYTDDPTVGTRALSFRVLSHAEVETYLEERVVEIAKVALVAWKKSKTVSIPTLHLLAFSGHQMQVPPEALEPPTENKRKVWKDLVDITERLTNSVTTFINRTSRQNHGVKEENLLAMLLPIGFPHDRCDELLLANLNDFGALRGEAAHSSGARQVQQAIDPKNEYDRVQLLILGLVSVDEELDRLLSLAKTTF